MACARLRRCNKQAARIYMYEKSGIHKRELVDAAFLWDN